MRYVESERATLPANAAPRKGTVLPVERNAVGTRSCSSESNPPVSPITPQASTSAGCALSGQPRASVCLVTHNGEAFLSAQLASLARQLTPSDELVVVDNDSRDSTRAILEAFRADHDGIVRVAFLYRNIGIAKGFELALSMASGRFLFLCDQDDVWLPARIDTQVRGLEGSDLSVCNAAFVDSELRPSGRTTFDLRIPSLGWSNLAKNSFIGCTMAARREALLPLLPIPERVPMHDWYFAQAAYRRRYRLHLVHEVMMLYRRHDKTASATGRSSNRPLLRRLADRARLLPHTVQLGRT